MATAHRILIGDISPSTPGEVLLRGWVYRLRVLGKTSFIILGDCSGISQCVAATETLHDHRLKVEDVLEIRGVVRENSRSKAGFEIQVQDVQVLKRAGNTLPLQSAADVEAIGLDTLQFRPLALRTEAVGDVFRIQAALLSCFRDALNRRRFTEIVTSKIVSGGTEGGSNLFEIQYFDRVAYLAQSPQFYKEQGVAGLERVYETGHVYRAEPHASSRDLTEYFSLDVEFGFIDGPEDVIQIERELLTDIFENLNSRWGNIIRKYRREPLPSMLETPCWEFNSCLEMLRSKFGRTNLVDDLDPEGTANFASLQSKRADSRGCSSLDFHLLHARSTPPRAGRRAPRAASICYSTGLKSQLEASACTGGKN